MTQRPANGSDDPIAGTDVIPPPAAVGEIVAGCHVVGLEDHGDPVWAMCRAVILLRTWEYLLRRSQASQVQRHP